MLLPFEGSQNSTDFIARLRQLSQHLLTELPPTAQTISESHIADLVKTLPDHVFVVRDGLIHGRNEKGQTLVSFEPGDICALSEGYGLKGMRLVADDFVQVDAYHIDLFLQHVHQSKRHQAIWSSYLLTNLALYQSIAGELVNDVELPAMGFSYYMPNDVIIRQGEEAHNVFSMVLGSADVFVDGVKVGEVLENEFFGDMAVFTGTVRSATVVAREPCTVISVERDEFKLLIARHPDTTATLIENLAQRVHTLNERLAEFENKQMES